MEIEKEKKTGDVPIEDLKPFLGLCCAIFSCFTEYPDCLGCAGSNTCLCLSGDIQLCKKSLVPDSCCKCCMIDLECIPVAVLCKSRTQFFCIDMRAAIPCAEDVPCLLNVCGCTVCFKRHCKVKCCATIGDLTDTENPKPMDTK